MAGPFVLEVQQDDLLELVKSDGSTVVAVPTVGGAGGVTAVTGSAPIASSGGATPDISITPATDLSAGSMSAADKTKLDSFPSTFDAWTFDAPIPASVASPALSQAQALAGPGVIARAISQASAAGSNANALGWSFVGGANDGTAVGPTAEPFFWFGQQLAPGPVAEFPPSNYWNYAILKGRGGGVVSWVLGGGANLAGSGVAGVEISAFSQMTIATEIGGTPQSDIIIQPASTFGGGQAFFRHLTDPTLGSPALVMGGFNDAPLVAQTGIIRLSPMASASHQPILVMRDEGNTTDLVMISRNFDAATWGNFNEDQTIQGNENISSQLAHQGGLGWNTFGPFGFVQVVGTDGQKTISHGTIGGGTGSGTQNQLFNTVSVATTQLCVTNSDAGVGVVIKANSVTRMKFTCIGLDTVTNEWTSFVIEQGYGFFGGTVTAATGAAPSIQEVQESNAGLAAGLSANLTITSNRIQLNVTPWSANNIQWITEVATVVNAGSGI